MGISFAGGSHMLSSRPSETGEAEDTATFVSFSVPRYIWWIVQHISFLSCRFDVHIIDISDGTIAGYHQLELAKDVVTYIIPKMYAL